MVAQDSRRGRAVFLLAEWAEPAIHPTKSSSVIAISMSVRFTTWTHRGRLLLSVFPHYLEKLPDVLGNDFIATVFDGLRICNRTAYA